MQVPGMIGQIPLVAADTKQATSSWACDLSLLTRALYKRLECVPLSGFGDRVFTECLTDLGLLGTLQRRSSDLHQAEITQLRGALELASANTHSALQRAHLDPLTRLPNRDVFFEQLDAVTARREPCNEFAVFYLDLDGFKAINDRYGHSVGDAVLCIVAKRLASAMRKEDLVCRIGGDEFTCLLLGMSDEQRLGEIATQLLSLVSAPVSVGSLQLNVRTSIGMAVGSKDGMTSARMVANADAAMYHAKQHGCGYALFDGLNHKAAFAQPQRKTQASQVPGNLKAQGRHVCNVPF